jgi:hypothetical protein
VAINGVSSAPCMGGSQLCCDWRIEQSEINQVSVATQTEPENEIPLHEVQASSINYSASDLAGLIKMPVWQEIIDEATLVIYAIGYQPVSGPFQALGGGYIDNQLDSPGVLNIPSVSPLLTKQGLFETSVEKMTLEQPINWADAHVFAHEVLDYREEYKQFGLNTWKLTELPNDLFLTSNAIFGFDADKTSEFHTNKVWIDWKNSDQVQTAQHKRSAYHQKLETQKKRIQKWFSEGMAAEKIAQTLVEERNSQRMNSYKTFGERLWLRKRNLLKYGHMMGPTYEQQLRRYGSADAVIQAALRSNASMDLLTGIAKVRWEGHEGIRV